MIKIEDIFKRELWTAEYVKNSTELVNFASGRHIVRDLKVAEKVNSQDAGTVIKIPYIAENEYVEPSVMNDSDDEITSNKVSKAEDLAYVGFYATSFAQRDYLNLVASGLNALDAAVSLFGRYWDKHLQKVQVNTLKGLIASNIANEDSDLVFVATGDGKDTFSYANFLEATNKIGDAGVDFTSVFCHSQIRKAMKLNDDIDVVLDSERGITIEKYNGLVVITNDSFVKNADDTYDVVIAKDGLFVFEMSDKVENPVAISKNEKAGNGAGETTVISRVGYLLHPQGYSVVLTEIGGESPTGAELQKASLWKRTSEAKDSKFVVLRCKA